jgi:hypothetical protein
MLDNRLSVPSFRELTGQTLQHTQFRRDIAVLLFEKHRLTISIDTARDNSGTEITSFIPFTIQGNFELYPNDRVENAIEEIGGNALILQFEKSGTIIIPARANVFIKVEATKYTEVGYVGRDVESMIRDLMAAGFQMVKQEMQESVTIEAEKRAEEALLDLLLPSGKKQKDKPKSSPVVRPMGAFSISPENSNSGLIGTAIQVGIPVMDIPLCLLWQY